jgi:hypothetical protein
MTTYTFTGGAVEESRPISPRTDSPPLPAKNPPAANGTEVPPAEANGIQWRTKAEMAEHFRCHIRTITKYMKRRILPYAKLGRWVRLDLAKCDKAMKKFERRGIYDE